MYGVYVCMYGVYGVTHTQGQRLVCLPCSRDLTLAYLFVSRLLLLTEQRVPVRADRGRARSVDVSV